MRVDGFHFRHADGTRHRPLGTTAYAWTHQPDALQEQTLRTLADAPFTKIRMCVFPKSYLYNANEPDDFVFPGSLDDGFDLERFDVAHFHRLEERIAQLADLGIEADLILFHAYDRWGFADLGPAVDERYLRYVVRRLSAYANVWWSMANEYDLLWSKDEADWERLAAIVGEEDPFGHLNSIHNCRPFYDYSKPWITHVSVQRVDVYRTAENTDEWRERWGKPVVIDECAYEGDIDQGWGNITGEEMIRRFWEGAVRGGYVGHGETYLPIEAGGTTVLSDAAGDDPEVLWWAKGGELYGTSPARIGVPRHAARRDARRRLGSAPVRLGRAMGRRRRPAPGRLLRVQPAAVPQRDPPRGRSGHVEVIDTWNLTIEPLEGTHSGTVRVDLPGRQFMALRAIRVA